MTKFLSSLTAITQGIAQVIHPTPNFQTITSFLLISAGCWLMISRQTPQPDQTWATKIPHEIRGQLSLSTQVIVADAVGGVWRIEQKTGKITGHTEIGSPISFSPLSLDDQHVLIVAEHGQLIALNLTDLKPVWQFTVPEFIEPELPVVEGDVIYFADKNNHLYVLYRHNGQLAWSRNLGFKKTSLSPADISPSEPNLFYSTDTNLYVADQKNQLMWSCQKFTGDCRELEIELAKKSMFGGDAEHVFAQNSSGQLLAFNHTTQQKDFVIAGSPNDQWLMLDTVLLRQRNSAITTFDLQTGQQLQNLPLPTPVNLWPTNSRENWLTTSQTGQFQTTISWLGVPTLTSSWQTTLPGICVEPTVVNNTSVFGCDDGKLYGLSNETVEIIWQKLLVGHIAKIVANPAANFIAVVSGSMGDGAYLTVTPNSKESHWWVSPLSRLEPNSLQQHGENIFAISHKNQLLRVTQSLPTDIDWQLQPTSTGFHLEVQPTKTLSYQNQTTKPYFVHNSLIDQLRLFKKLPIWWEQLLAADSFTITTTKTSPIIELTLSGQDITNVTAEFWQTKKTAQKVKGFIHSANEHQVRFFPSHEGVWFWKLQFRKNGFQKTIEGSTKDVPVPHNQFVKIDKNQWLQGDKPFAGIGFQTCILDQDWNGNWLDNWIIGVANTPGGDQFATIATSEKYFQSMETAGFTLYRLSLDNCSFRLFTSLSDSNFTPNLQASHATDEILTTAKKKKLATVFTIFGFEPFTPTSQKKWLDFRLTNQQLSPGMSKYLEYIIARYGSLIDVWELSNEANPSNEWITSVSNYLREHDPYHHPISTSWERPQNSNLDAQSLHYFGSEPLSTIFDVYMRPLLRTNYKKTPILVGEAGNMLRSWDPESLTRFTYKNWLHTFLGIPVIWWEHSRNLYEHPTTANVYIGPEERSSVSHLRRFQEMYLQTKDQRHFELQLDQHTNWLGIETPTHWLLYPTKIPTVEKTFLNLKEITDNKAKSAGWHNILTGEFISISLTDSITTPNYLSVLVITK